MSATQLASADLQPFWASVNAAAVVPTPAFAAKFAAVLAGDCDAALNLAVRPHRTTIWDYAASALLLAEAGGQFASIDGANLLWERPLDYTGGWLASPPALLDRLVAIAQRSVS